MALRSPETIQVAGTAATYHAADGTGDKVSTTGRIYLHVKNASAASVTATIVTPGTVAGQAIGDVAVSVPASGERFIGPLTREHFANSDGQVDVTWSATASVTFAVLRA